MDLLNRCRSFYLSSSEREARISESILVSAIKNTEIGFSFVSSFSNCILRWQDENQSEISADVHIFEEISTNFF